MSHEGIRLAKKWFIEHGESTTMAVRLGRDPSTMTRILVKRTIRTNVSQLRSALTGHSGMASGPLTLVKFIFLPQ